MRSAFSRWILNLLGWKIIVNFPDDLKKYVVAVVPHTSSWDFPLGLLVRSAIEKDIKFVGKHTLFKPPHGWIMKALGGVPVNRQKSGNFVKAVVDEYDRRENFAICIAPEGTRKRVNKLKTGFYYIAKSSGAAIVLCKFDFANKTVEFDKPFYPTDNQEADFAYIDNYFSGVLGKRPEYSYK
ncbi:MAG: lysophospholipid acyltransferase family protein [Bacteroidota bacterium]